MTRRFLLAQVSDPHIGADWAGGDPAAGLAATVASVAALRPDAVLVSGDLADHATDAEYEQVRVLLAPLGDAVHVLPGNHDDRRAMRAHFGLPGTGDEPVQYAVDLGPLRLVVLDTTRPGFDDGELGAARLAWLEATLAAAPGAPTIVAMHHPPLLTGIAEMDEFALRGEDRQALAALIARHPQVRRIVAGHVHRTITTTLAGCPVLTVSSTYVQARLDLRSPSVSFVAEPAGFALHALTGDELLSHVQPVV